MMVLMGIMLSIMVLVARFMVLVVQFTKRVDLLFLNGMMQYVLTIKATAKQSKVLQKVKHIKFMNVLTVMAVM